MKLEISAQLPQACNSQLSQGLGRRLYNIQQGAKHYWLKVQLVGFNPISEQTFLNELTVYQQLMQYNMKMLLPFEILDSHRLFKTAESYLPTALLLQDAPALFAQSPMHLSHDQILQILLQSLDAVSHLHQVGYLHGDLKPQHFRLHHKKCYLIDFEQTALFQQLQPHHSATPHYMAPELFHAEAKSIQSDIYALGIIWLEWLTQQRLREKSYLDWAYLHCQHLKVQLPAQFFMLDALLTGMLHKIKSQRLADIYEIKQRLTEFV